MSPLMILEGDEIPYREQAELLFDPVSEGYFGSRQRLVPFLGAGVSISGKAPPLKPVNAPSLPDLQLIDRFCSELGLESNRARGFLRAAAFLALQLDIANEEPQLTEQELLEVMLNDEFPPSAGELTRLLVEHSRLMTLKPIVTKLKEVLPKDLIGATDEEQIAILKQLASILGIVDSSETLTKVSNYYENKEGRDKLWNVLRQVISDKSKVTSTHNLIAAAAKHHLNQATANDYLILTTNYDNLMEEALTEVGVDYAVLVVRRSNEKVIVNFSEGMKHREELEKEYSDRDFAEYVTLSKLRQPIIVIHKLHGSLTTRPTDTDDSVVISESDYADYLAARSRIPTIVMRLLRDQPILFLGYSLSDLNVQRTLLRANPHARPLRHYAVTYRVNEQEHQNFERFGVTVLKTDLNTYVNGVLGILQSQAK